MFDIVLFSFLFCFNFVNSLEDFVPKIEWECSKIGVDIHLETESPFGGILYPYGRREECAFSGNGKTKSQFQISFEKCQIEKINGKRKFLLEIHEHRILILEADKTVEIECWSVEDSLSDSVENTTEVLPIRNDPEFDVELWPLGDAVRYGDSAELRINVRSVESRHFRIHSCLAKSGDQIVNLIGQNGCSLDRRLIGDFRYEGKNAKSRIASMFRFPDSVSIRFQCSLFWCPQNDECQPNCDLKVDDPISEILRSNSEELEGSGLPPLSDFAVSAIVQIMEPLSPTTTPFSIEPNITGCRCDLPDELVLLYRLCIGLSFLFALGCCCNIFFCCMNFHRSPQKKQRSVPKTPQRNISRNQYWISDLSAKDRNPGAFDEFSTQCNEISAPIQPIQSIHSMETENHDNSMVSYASLRPRQPISHTNASAHYSTPTGAGVRHSPQRSSYESRTFHSNTNSMNTSNASAERHSIENPPIQLTTSLSSSVPPEPKETFSIF